MVSIYDELSGKIDRAAPHSARDGARRDLGLLLFAEREALSDLWKAADRCARLLHAEESADMREAVDRLRPLFGERAG
jgi:dsDNA-binding SOS-regulon protein